MTRNGRNFRPCAHKLLSKRSAAIENRAGDSDNKQEEVRIETAFLTQLNRELYLGKSYTHIGFSLGPRVQPSPAGLLPSWSILDKSQH